MVTSDHLPDQVKFPDWFSANNSDCRVFSVINKIRRLHSDDKGFDVTKKPTTTTITFRFSTTGQVFFFGRPDHPKANLP